MTTRLSFRAWLTLQWTLAFGCVLALASVAIYVGTRSFLTADLAAQLRTLAGTELASATDSGIHLHEFPAASLGQGEYAGKFVQLVDLDGKVLIQSADHASAPSLLPVAVVRAAATGEAPLTPVVLNGRRGLMTALPINADGNTVVLAVGLYTDRLDATLARLSWLLFAVSALGLGLTAVVGFVLATRALRPIAHIAERAGTIARGHFDARLEPPMRQDEIGRMTVVLNEMLDRLQAALDANRRFASDASHELRSPLTAMLGELEVALKRDRDAAEYRESLAIVRDRTKALTALVEDLMILVRAQEGAPPPITEIPLGHVLQAAATRLEPLADERQIAIHIAPMDALTIYADPALLARVFDNVLRNAVLYNIPGGRVDVSADLEPADGGTWAAATAVIRVCDTGHGIPEAEWDRVFERFYRTDQSRSRRTGGTGIGLSIASEVVRLFGGAIRVADSSPAGTTIEIRLPGGQGKERTST